MLRVNVDGEKFALNWQHSFFPNNKTDVKSQTTCFLFVGDKKSPEYTADSYCSVNDKYDKEIGRKVSLKRVLDMGNFTKEQRQQFWAGYFGRKRLTNEN